MSEDLYFRNVTAAIDFVLALDLPPESTVTAYDVDGTAYRIPLPR